MVTVGKNILDNLTTGMYSDSKVIYREYIQNACDQIDLAIRENILRDDEGVIDIFIDHGKRYISIKDNATGVRSDNFISDLGDIANSNKAIGKNKGFRGIGRLCGLAYCKILKFTTSFKGESNKSIMICDAKKMREMLYENKKYTLDEIWEEIVSFEIESESIEKHYFEVEMIDINQENTDLLDAQKVRDYLSFVAPVPYKNTFIFRHKIYEHAQKLGYKIDEYCIRVNGAEIFKEYTTRLKESSGNALKGYDEISKLEFKDFYDGNRLIAWMWIGLSRFEKQIPKINQMRGIRLKSANIQLGDDDVLQALFKESRGNYYFVGEVFAVYDKLIPNSQRDYFNENEARVTFEDLLREYFFDVLHKLYYDANKIKNAYKRQEDYIAKIEEFKSKVNGRGFVNEEEKKKLQFGIEKAKKEAVEAQKTLSKFESADTTSPIVEVHKSIGQKFNSDKLTKKAKETEMLLEKQDNKKQSYMTSNMSKLTRNERKLVSKILAIITNNAPEDVAKNIIEKIKEEMK